MIRNLIWDVDGTLFDTYPAIVAAYQLLDYLVDINAGAAPTGEATNFEATTGAASSGVGAER